MLREMTTQLAISKQQHQQRPLHIASLPPRRGASREDGLQGWKVAGNMLHKQYRRADKGWSFSLGVDEE